jgi:hypothetical protein
MEARDVGAGRSWVGLVVVAIVVACSTQDASAGSGDRLLGRYAFNWLDPDKAKCAKVTDQLASEFSGPEYSCASSNTTTTQVEAVNCASKDHKKEYLVFTTYALCENERKIQAANGD